MHAVRSARVTGSREFILELKCGIRRTGMVGGGSFVAPWLTIVRWRPQGAYSDRTLLILPDMVDPEEFRRLRVLLRWSAFHCSIQDRRSKKIRIGC
jgi:toxin CptA